MMNAQTRIIQGRQDKQFIVSSKAVGGAGSRIIEFIASTENPDRSNDIIDVAGWILDNYISAVGKAANPIFAWSHDYTKLPVGKTVFVAKDLRLKALIIRVYFPTIAELCSDTNHPSDEALFADTVYNMYVNGMLNAVSVGFDPKKYETRDDDAVQALPEWLRGYHFLTQELLEVSAVLVPCNADAVTTMRSMKSFKKEGIKLVEAAMKTKGTIPFHAYPLADEDTAWDAGEVVKASDTADLKKICTWYDSSKDEADLTKGDFKLPHHESSADGFKTVWNGVKAAMGALFGARGGTTIPEAEQKGCYDHLAKHYKEFEKDPPDWGKSYSAEELKAVFGEEGSMTEAEIKALEDRIVARVQVKAGAKFSAETKETISKACDALKASHKAIKAVHESLKAMIDEEAGSGTEGTDDGTDNGVEKPKPNTEEAAAKELIRLKSLDIATASLEDATALLGL